MPCLAADVKGVRHDILARHGLLVLHSRYKPWVTLTWGVKT